VDDLEEQQLLLLIFQKYRLSNNNQMIGVNDRKIEFL